jgi:hypothetical protein
MSIYIRTYIYTSQAGRLSIDIFFYTRLDFDVDFVEDCQESIDTRLFISALNAGSFPSFVDQKVIWPDRGGAEGTEENVGDAKTVGSESLLFSIPDATLLFLRVKNLVLFYGRFGGHVIPRECASQKYINSKGITISVSMEAR